MKVDTYTPESYEIVKDGPIYVDGWRGYEMLSEGDAPVDSGYRGSEFVVESPNGHRTPINLHVTGRTVQCTSKMGWGNDMVRVRVEFVRDCEESQWGAGWVKVRKINH